MPLYFVADNENPNYDNLRVKIGISKHIEKRIRQLQTGSPQELKLMGQIKSKNDRDLEAELHKKYSANRLHGEWFLLSVSDVLEALRAYSTSAYIAVNSNAFEICSYDSDRVPEFVGAWQWDDVDFRQFCPACGWGGGLSYNENYGGERCLECGFTGE